MLAVTSVVALGTTRHSKTSQLRMRLQGGTASSAMRSLHSHVLTLTASRPYPLEFSLSTPKLR